MLRRLVVLAPLAAAPAAVQPALVERGRAPGEGIMACGNCHTPWDAQGEVAGMAMAGGGVIGERAFRAVVPNITPHPDAGIGAWSDADLAQAITQGVSASGRPLAPPVGFAYYARLSAGELADIIANLRNLPPQR